MQTEDRTRELTKAALNCAKRTGFTAVTRDAIAAEAGVSNALVTVRMGTMREVKRAIMRAAIDSACLKVIAEGLAVNDRHARKAPQELKDAAAAWVRTR
jgi:AcrR family transcriptional regulator